MGIEDVDVTDYKAVAKWLKERRQELDAQEEKARKELEAHNISSTTLQHDLDLTNMPDEIREVFERGMAELDRRQKDLEDKLAATQGNKAGAGPAALEKYTKL